MVKKVKVLLDSRNNARQNEAESIVNYSNVKTLRIIFLCVIAALR